MLTRVNPSEPMMHVATMARGSFSLLLEELIVTAGLVGVILATGTRGVDVVAGAVVAYIAVAIWSTSSISSAG